MIRCLFPCEEYKHGQVFSIDHDMLEDDIVLRNDRAKVAKFLGLYYDIATKRAGYSGPEDIIASCMNDKETYIKLKSRHGYSSFPHEHYRDPTAGKQKDNYNCGIIGMKLSLNALSGNLDKLRAIDTLQANCNKFRRGLFHFLGRWWNFLIQIGKQATKGSLMIS